MKTLQQLLSKLAIALCVMCVVPQAMAETYQDDFTGKQASLSWKALDDACLSAGSGDGSIPRCNHSGLPTKPDGEGALVLTPDIGYRTGAIISDFTFPLNQGLEVTFTTFTYGTDTGGAGGMGADGLTFFMTEARNADGIEFPAPTEAGGSGGALGYSCSNGNPNASGLANAYLGLGVDEYGNFLNKIDNTNTGVPNDGTTWSDGKAQHQANRIGLRGRGNTTWAWLHQQNPRYYPKAYDAGKMQAACREGQYVYTGNSNTSRNKRNIDFNYNVIDGGYKVLPRAQRIASNSGNKKDAWPITYRLKISESGLLNFDYSYNSGDFQPVIANRDITEENGPIPQELRFGFSAGTGGSRNIHEIACFRASPIQSDSSAGSNTVSGEEVGDTNFYLASYSEDGWWGSLVASPLVIDSATDELNIGSAKWDADCVLTGGECQTVRGSNGGATNANKQTERNVFTWNGSVNRSSAAANNRGVVFAYENFTSAVRNIFGSETIAKQRINWLLGDQSNEQLQGAGGTLRARKHILGDIISSSPTFSGPPRQDSQPDRFIDLLDTFRASPETAHPYSSYATSKAGRTGVVLVGSNDGFLHAFSDDTGKELFAYMPYDVLRNKAVSLTEPSYSHDYLVDATPTVGDVFYAGKWHTWAAAGVGSNGKEIFVLDITDPENFNGSHVIGDWSQNELQNLGNTVGSPIFDRMHNGQWAVIFGNGINSNHSNGGIYIGLIDPQNEHGKVNFKYLPVGEDVAYVSSVDLDGDGIADYLYAGTVQGKVWRIDVTSGNANDWHVSTFGNSSRTPLFVDSSSRPITTSILALATDEYEDGNARVMLYFGTGQQTPKSDTSDKQYANGQHHFYGVWDWDMNEWNNKSMEAKYVALNTSQAPSNPINTNNLLNQMVVNEMASSDPNIDRLRTLSTEEKVCWKGSGNCQGTNDHYGWRFALPDSGDTANEQIIYSPAYIGGAVVVNTAVPPSSESLCEIGVQSGWTMSFNPSTGGGMPEDFFDRGSGFDSGADTVAGARIGGVGTPTEVVYQGESYLVTQTSSGSAVLADINPSLGGGQGVTRVSWRELLVQ